MTEVGGSLHTALPIGVRMFTRGTARLFCRAIAPPTDNLIEEVLQDVQLQEKNNNTSWLLQKVQDRPVTTHAVIAFKAVWLIHYVSLQPTVKIQTIAALSPVLGRILVAWDTTNNELSKKRPLFPGETVQQDEENLRAALAVYAQLVDIRVACIASLDGIISNTWDANSSFLSLNNSEQSLSVVLHVVIERLIDVIKQLYTSLSTLTRDRTCIFFCLYIFAIKECLQDGPCLLLLIAKLLSRHVSPVRKAGPPTHDLLVKVYDNLADTLRLAERLSGRYTFFADIVPVYFQTLNQALEWLNKIYPDTISNIEKDVISEHQQQNPATSQVSPPSRSPVPGFASQNVVSSTTRKPDDAALQHTFSERSAMQTQLALREESSKNNSMPILDAVSNYALSPLPSFYLDIKEENTMRPHLVTPKSGHSHTLPNCMHLTSEKASPSNTRCPTSKMLTTNHLHPNVSTSVKSKPISGFDKTSFLGCCCWDTFTPRSGMTSSSSLYDTYCTTYNNTPPAPAVSQSRTRKTADVATLPIPRQDVYDYPRSEPLRIHMQIPSNDRLLLVQKDTSSSNAFAMPSPSLDRFAFCQQLMTFSTSSSTPNTSSVTPVPNRPAKAIAQTSIERHIVDFGTSQRTPDVNNLERSQFSSNNQILIPTTLNKATVENFTFNLDDVTFDKRVGEGADAEVFRAKWRGSIVAIKRLKKKTRSAAATSSYTAVQTCFFQELSFMIRLRHPNLVLFMGASVQQDEFCVMMEYCAGGTLFEFLHSSKKHAKRKLSWTQKRQICIDIAKAMLFLHTASPPIIHRDLKSLNVLFARPILTDQCVPVTKVSDFGLSYSDEAKSGICVATYHYQNGVVGTFPWMAPEIMAGRPYSEKADVYSYGIILYELVTETVPEFKSVKDISELSSTLRQMPEDSRFTSFCDELRREFSYEYNGLKVGNPSNINDPFVFAGALLIHVVTWISAYVPVFRIF